MRPQMTNVELLISCSNDVHSLGLRLTSFESCLKLSIRHVPLRWSLHKPSMCMCVFEYSETCFFRFDPVILGFLSSITSSPVRIHKTSRVVHAAKNFNHSRAQYQTSKTNWKGWNLRFLPILIDIQFSLNLPIRSSETYPRPFFAV